MFWTGVIIGIFIGSALGILIMSMAISASRNSSEDHSLEKYGMEASKELSPDTLNNKFNTEDNKNNS
ncbi:hypothetical protein [Defluviitalea phaphyphila]|uniref:hypothetical protein n=1 Tax=Defluviitalea phaphyphila TaxID=1473580 RepID=UPI00072FBF62|nr:hypothetical protein [Defluviitalea phaphyphila]